MSSNFDRNCRDDDSHDNGRASRPFNAAQIIARAKELIADRDFPTDMIVVEVARLMALREYYDRDSSN